MVSCAAGGIEERPGADSFEELPEMGPLACETLLPVDKILKDVTQLK